MDVQQQVTNENHLNGYDKDKTNENDSIKIINKLLQLNLRKKALAKYDWFIKTCNDSAFSDNCIKWLQFCCKYEGIEVPEVEAGLKLFSKIITVSAEFPELGRQVSNSVTNRFLDVFCKHFFPYKEGWNSLETFLLKYHGSLTSHKESLDGLLNNGINKAGDVSVDEARCFALFPLAGGGGTKNAIYKSNWKDQFEKLINSSHNVLNVLFKDAKELHSYDVSNCSTMDFNEEYEVSRLVNILSHYGLIIESMLLGQFPASKTIPVDSVLKLISRCVSITENTLKNKAILRTAELCKLLPVLHSKVIKILSALIVSCKKALLPLATTISKILEQALQNTSHSANTKLALAVYSCLGNWFTAVQGAGCGNQLIKNLLSVLLNDCQQKRDILVLRGKDKSKDAVRDKLNQFSCNEKLCFAALKTLEMLLNTAGYKIDANQHKAIQAELLGLAYNIDRENCSNKWVFNSSVRCREALYLVIIQLCLEPCPQWPPPTQYALKIFKMGLNDNSPLIRKTCSVGSSILQRIVYPEFSIASFPGNYQNLPKEKQLDAASAMEVEDVNILQGIGEEQSPKQPVKLVTKTSSPWQSFNTKHDYVNEMSPTNGEDLIQRNRKRKISSTPPPSPTHSENTQITNVKGDSEVTVITGSALAGDLNARKKDSPDQLSEEIQDNAKTSLPGQQVAAAPEGDFFESHEEIAEGTQIVLDDLSNVAVTGESDSPVTAPSEDLIIVCDDSPIICVSDDHKKSSELDSPMSLRSGTILGSPSVPENVRQSQSSSPTLDDISGHQQSNRVNEPSPTKRAALCVPSEITRRTRSTSVSSQGSVSCERKAGSELDSPMSLRSGTLLVHSAADNARQVRGGSVSSQNSISCGQQKPVPSPIYEEVEVDVEKFDDTVREDYF